MASPKTPIQPPKKGMSKKKKTVITLVIVAVVVALIAGIVIAVALSNRNEINSADRKTVATCNGYDIPYEELYFVTMFYKDALVSTYGADIWDSPTTAEKYRNELETLVAEHLCENYLVLSACRYLGIKTGGSDIDQYVDEQMKALRASCSSQKEYEAWLAEHWMTENYMRFSIGVSYLESAIYYTLLDNNLFTYTLNNADEFCDYVENSGNYVRTIHVFIENAEGEDPASNLAEAQKISDALRAIEDPQERRELMGDYIGSTVNDDLLAVTGDGYYFTRGEMDEIYEDASFDLAMGEVSQPVVCSGGTFVIMRLYPEAEYVQAHLQELLNGYHGVAVGLYEEQFREKCQVVFNEYGSSIDLVYLK